MTCDDLGDDALEGAAVTDLLQAACLYDGIGAAFTLPHSLKYLLGDLAGDAAIKDSRNQPAEIGRGHGTLGKACSLPVKLPQQLDLHPVGGDLCVATGGYDDFEIVSQRATVCQHAGIVVAQAVRLCETMAFVVGSSGKRVLNIRI